VAVRAGALRVGAEQGRLDAVGLGERLADRVEQAGVGGRVAAPRALDGALVDGYDTFPAGHRTVDERALPGARHAGDDDKHAQRDVHVDVLEVVGARATHLDRSPGLADAGLESSAVLEVPAGERPAGAQ